MQAYQFLKTVTADKSNFLERLLNLLDSNGIKFCVVGGVAVSAYAEPVLSLDFDFVVASYQQGRFESLLANTFMVRRGSRLTQITTPESRLRANVYTESRYAEFVERAEVRRVLDLRLPVARAEDVLRSKIWMVEDVSRRPSQRLSDLADITRMIDANPRLYDGVPQTILQRIAAMGA